MTDNHAPRPDTSNPTLEIPVAQLAPQPVPPMAPPVPPAPRPHRARWIVGSVAATLVLVGAVGTAYAVGSSQHDEQPSGVTPVVVAPSPASPTVAGTTAAPDSAATVVTTPPAAPTGQAQAVNIRYDDAEIDIEDHSGDGQVVNIDRVRTSIPAGFVVVTDRAGTILGTVPVTSGAVPTSVKLTTPIVGCTELTATLWADDGDGIFDPARDALVVEPDDDHEYDIVDEDVDYCAR